MSINNQEIAPQILKVEKGQYRQPREFFNLGQRQKEISFYQTYVKFNFVFVKSV